MNIPLERIGSECRARYQAEQRLIVYCSDEECPSSDLAARKLEAFGFQQVLEYGGGKKGLGGCRIADGNRRLRAPRMS